MALKCWKEFKINRIGEKFEIASTRILKRDLVCGLLAVIQYTVFRYVDCWTLFGTQYLGMDSAGRYSVHSLLVWTVLAAIRYSL